MFIVVILLCSKLENLSNRLVQTKLVRVKPFEWKWMTLVEQRSQFSWLYEDRIQWPIAPATKQSITWFWVLISPWIVALNTDEPSSLISQSTFLNCPKPCTLQSITWDTPLNQNTRQMHIFSLTISPHDKSLINCLVLM